MRIEKKKVIEIQKELRIRQKDHDLILESGDKIEVLNEEGVIKKFKAGWYIAGRSEEDPDTKMFMIFTDNNTKKADIEYAFESGDWDNMNLQELTPEKFMQRIKKPFKINSIVYTNLSDSDKTFGQELVSKYSIEDQSDTF